MDELEKFRQYRRTRDPKLRDELILAYRPLAERLARQFVASREPIEDLVSEATIGLIKAIDQFNPNRGVQFNTYATHVINGHIYHYLRDWGKVIKEPAWMQEKRVQINRFTEQFYVKNGRQPTSEEIAHALNIKRSIVDHILQTRELLQVESLDAAVEFEEGEGAHAADLERLEVEEAADSGLPFEDQIALRDALSKLREVERKAILYFFYQEYSKTEIAEMMGISANYVGYLIKRGLSKLRDMLSPREGGLVTPSTSPLSPPSEGKDVGEIRAPIKPTERAAKQRPEAKAPPRTLEDYERELARLKRTDEVTQFMVESYFMYRLQEDIKRAKRYNHPLAVAFLLCPTLFELSRTLTETQFAQLLTEVANALRSITREVDYFARLSDYEFAVALPHTERSARIALNRMRKKLETTDFQLADSRQLSLQYGLAIFPKDGNTPSALLREAHRRAQEAEE